MPKAFHPEDASAVAAIVAEADAAGTRLEIVGTGTRRGYGRPIEADAMLDLSALSGIVDYDPAELVLTALPSTPTAEIEALLAVSGQHLAFEPVDQAPLWGGGAGGGTLAGAVGCGLSGPRRPAAGAVRDHVLGFTAVNGLGETFSAGGKVIKNVTGYDLPKLVTGALGTLAALTEITVKALPAPSTTTTIALAGLSDPDAIAVMTGALNGPAAVSGAAHLPSGVASDERALTLLRIEGVAISVQTRVEALIATLHQPAERIDLLDEAASRTLWRDIGGVHAFAGIHDLVWRISLPPSRAAAFVAGLSSIAAARCYYDWGGGLVWLFLPPEDNADPAIVRTSLAQAAGRDGHATLVRAPASMRRGMPFQPLDPGLAILSERVRQRFDPNGTFNPGRIYGGA